MPRESSTAAVHDGGGRQAWVTGAFYCHYLKVVSMRSRLPHGLSLIPVTCRAFWSFPHETKRAYREKSALVCVLAA